MRRVTAGVVGLACCLGVPAGLGERAGTAGPAGQAGGAAPPWQRLLQGEDARKAGALQGRAVVAWQAGRWEEAVRAAEELWELR
jgi:hypothetical protein